MSLDLDSLTVWELSLAVRLHVAAQAKAGRPLPQRLIDVGRYLADADDRIQMSVPVRNHVVSPFDADTVNTDQAAELLGVHPRTVRRRCQRGDLEARQLTTGRWLIRLPDDTKDTT